MDLIDREWSRVPRSVVFRQPATNRLLTEGVVRVEGAYDAGGQPSQEVLELGACNAALETGVASPLDDAVD
ncbi:MAG: hypothetical protein ACM3SQ_01970 [Betaproteobacteria bacterium]